VDLSDNVVASMKASLWSIFPIFFDIFFELSFSNHLFRTMEQPLRLKRLKNQPQIATFS